MRNLITLLLLLVASFSFGYEAGTANQVVRVPSGGGRPLLGSIDLSTAAAVGSSVLGPTNGGTNQSAWTAGDLMYSPSTNTLGKLNIGAAGTLVNSSGTLPQYTLPVNLGISTSRNFLLNSNFGLWQRGTSVTIANTVSTYQADRWYVKNSLGTNGVITFSQVAAVTNGSLFGAKVQITTAPTAAQVNGTELYQTLDNQTSSQLYGQTASFSILVKALGNVNQVGCQFYYKTTEAKVDTSIGSEQTATVSTGGFTTCSISGQALGTSQTAAGVVGVRVRITTVSSGNTYDLNNGFIVEQAMLNLGTSPATWSAAFPIFANEVAALQRFYEKSYDLATAPGTATAVGSKSGVAISPTDFYDRGTLNFKVTKRAVPTITAYSIATGTAGQVRDIAANADRAAGTFNIGTQSMGGFTITGATALNSHGWHWTADAEI
jgi:hypothetical protein